MEFFLSIVIHDASLTFKLQCEFHEICILIKKNHFFREIVTFGNIFMTFYYFFIAGNTNASPRRANLSRECLDNLNANSSVVGETMTTPIAAEEEVNSSRECLENANASRPTNSSRECLENANVSRPTNSSRECLDSKSGSTPGNNAQIAKWLGIFKKTREIIFWRLLIGCLAESTNQKSRIIQNLPKKSDLTSFF